MYYASCSPANLIKPDKLSFLLLLDFCYFDVLGVREGVAIFLPFCGTFAQDGVVEMSRPCQWNAGAAVPSAESRLSHVSDISVPGC